MRIQELTITGLQVDAKTGQAEERTVTFKVAPTPAAKLGKARLIFRKSGTEMTEESIEALIEAVFHGARRAGAQITLEWLQANVDSHNLAEVSRVFREVNTEVSGEEPAPGEAPAATTS